ncbi:hypothetical protein ACODUO_15130 [Stenotrophomonas maltophilia]
MDVEQRARELMRSEYMLSLSGAGPKQRHLYECAIRAIIAALTPPEGYVLVPVEMTEAMQRAGAGIVCTDVEEIRQVWAAMLAARPEVKP